MPKTNLGFLCEDADEVTQEIDNKQTIYKPSNIAILSSLSHHSKLAANRIN
tara:strand:+ start:2736 stop:2888 length:153 start_codon:yes stop_codon:yes gene_type:complete